MLLFLSEIKKVMV